MNGENPSRAKNLWQCQSYVASVRIGGGRTHLFPQLGPSCSELLMKKSH